MTRGPRHSAPDALARLAAGARARRLTHVEHLPARPAQHADWPTWVHPIVRTAYESTGIERPWSHQAAAAELAYAGTHVALSTGTASGKSLAFTLPALTAALDAREGMARRGATTLYLSPTKALAADQLARLEALAIPGIRAATYDGDTPPDERRWVRDHASYVLTNPDLIHASLLPGHQRWAPFLRGLAYVVVDESHVYRGVFGAHVSGVLRRLLRVAARYGASPTVVFTSATASEPATHARALTGLDVMAITEDGSPRAGLTFGLWEPEIREVEGAPSRRSTLTETAELLADLVTDDIQTVAFARSRQGVEALAARTREMLTQDDGSAGAALASRVAAYRGGYLPEERRILEQALRERELLGLAATNALELGIDISGLDAVLMAGWPGRLASLWQQAGRAGRTGRDALALFVAADDPLDTYLVHHPEAIFGRPVESPVLDPANPYVLSGHLACAAAELPLTADDARWFGASTVPLAESLVAGGLLRARPTGWYWTRPDRPTDHVSLRGIGSTVRLVEARTGRVLGTVDEERAHSHTHTGAVHLHQGRTYVVRDLDLDDGCAQVVAGDPGWITQARSTSAFEVMDISAQEVWGDNGVTWSRGQVRVRSQVTSFLRRLPTGEVIGEHPLDLPERELLTQAVWWTADEATLHQVIRDAGISEPPELVLPGALHGAEHAAIGLLPLVATCDRWDIGGVSTVRHPDTDLPTVMVYDGYPGGAGFAERGFRMAHAWLSATAEAMSTCGCETGCPSCVHSPKCGNGNEPLHKAGALAILRHLLRQGDAHAQADQPSAG